MGSFDGGYNMKVNSFCFIKIGILVRILGKHELLMASAYK